MDRLLSAVGPVDRSKSTRARACIWAGSTPACVLELACEVAVPCIQKDAFVRACAHASATQAQREVVGSCAALALPFESVHTPRDGAGPSRKRPAGYGPVRLAKDRWTDRSVPAETGGRTGSSGPRPVKKTGAPGTLHPSLEGYKQ